MKLLSFSRIRKFIILITILLIAGCVGYKLGERNYQLSVSSIKKSIIKKDAPQTTTIDFSLFWDVWGRLHRYHIDAVNIDNQKLVWGAIKGMVEAVSDPYTVFLPPQENKEFKDDLGGAFEGIGAQLGLKNGRIIIVAPLRGSPAEESGVKPGDWIIKVDEKDTVNWSLNQAVSNIRGKKSTEVILTVIRDGEQKPIQIPIIRDTIKIPSVEFWVKSPSQIEQISGLKLDITDRRRVAYLVLTRFGDRLDKEWGEGVLEILQEQSHGDVAGMILDLRNNPGGYLDGSVYIGSEFLKSGVVVTQENSDGSKVEYKVNREGRLLDIPLVVLINKGSASASEIVAGALKDYKRAVIFGETSFGKGSVQSPQDLKDGSGLHITTGKWLTPLNNSISEKGITPDIEVLLEEYEASKDAQLAESIKYLLK